MENQELTEEQRLAIIAEVVRSVKAGETIIEGDQDMIDDYKAEQATEDFVVEHGLLNATEEDVLDEAERLDSIDHKEEVDFDADENETDMENVSLAMRGELE